MKHIAFRKTFLILALSALMVTGVSAHHSYAIYDIDNKIERTGVLKELNYVQPHINLVVESVCEDGSIETWEIVSKSTRLWDRDGHDRNFASEGDTITIVGWPSRTGKDEMALSEVHSDKLSMVIRDVIRQRGAREDLPEETVTPTEC